MEGSTVERIKNPFIDDAIVEGDDYCPRERIENHISTKLKNGHNLALIGDRRIGKTSTAHFVIDNIKGTHKVDIDLYHVKDSSDIAESIIDACKKVLDEVWDSKKVTRFQKKLEER